MAAVTMVGPHHPRGLGPRPRHLAPVAAVLSPARLRLAPRHKAPLPPAHQAWSSEYFYSGLLTAAPHLAGRSLGALVRWAARPLRWLDTPCGEKVGVQLQVPRRAGAGHPGAQQPAGGAVCGGAVGGGGWHERVS
jgi:hypothetical protein